MKSVTFSNGLQMAVDNEGEGVFSRQKDGTWQQWAGTSQAPHFRTPQQFSAYLHRNYENFDGLRMVDYSSNW